MADTTPVIDVQAILNQILPVITGFLSLFVTFWLFKALFGFLKALQQANPNYDRSSMIGLSLDNDFKSKGQTVRNDKLEATVTAVVRKVLPNGNLFVEGRKAILVNDEEHHLYVSGVARPEDVQRDNTVLSSRLAEVQVEFTGRGLLTDRTKPGWFTRLLDWIWPF